MAINASETMFLSITQVDERRQKYEVCLDAPPHIVSDGLWRSSPQNTRTPMRSFLPLFELQVLLIFAITQICRLILMPFKVPLFISQMMVCLNQHLFFLQLIVCIHEMMNLFVYTGWANSASSFCGGTSGVVHEGAVSVWNSRHHHNNNVDRFCAFHFHKRCADGF